MRPPYTRRNEREEPPSPPHQARDGVFKSANTLAANAPNDSPLLPISAGPPPTGTARFLVAVDTAAGGTAVDADVRRQPPPALCGDAGFAFAVRCRLGAIPSTGPRGSPTGAAGSSDGHGRGGGAGATTGDVSSKTSGDGDPRVPVPSRVRAPPLPTLPPSMLPPSLPAPALRPPLLFTLLNPALSVNETSVGSDGRGSPEAGPGATAGDGTAAAGGDPAADRWRRSKSACSTGTSAGTTRIPAVLAVAASTGMEGPKTGEGRMAGRGAPPVLGDRAELFPDPILLKETETSTQHKSCSHAARKSAAK